MRWLLLLTFAAAALSACSPADHDASGDNVVVLYHSVDDHIAAPILDLFERETGVRVLRRGDTEATKTTGLVQTIRAQRDRPRADVFWSSEIFQTIRLADEGALAPQDFSSEPWPDSYSDPQGRWRAIANRTRVVVYNTRRVKPSEAPKTLHDLTNPRWRRRLVMARPHFGTTRGHMAHLLSIWGEPTTRRWLEAIHANGVRLLDGNAAVVRAVATGEADVGLTDSDDVWAGRRNNWPVDMIAIRHDLPGGLQSGPLLIPGAVALIAGAPHPAAARRLIDFLLSERVERLLSQGDAHTSPVRPSLAEEFADTFPPGVNPIDYQRAADVMPQAMRLVDETLDP